MADNHPYMKRKNTQRTFIREWRKHRGMSQETLASRIDMSSANLSRIEAGLQGYTQANLESIAGVVGCTPADLLERDPNDPSVALADRLRNLSPEDTENVQRIVDALAAQTPKAS